MLNSFFPDLFVINLSSSDIAYDNARNKQLPSPTILYSLEGYSSIFDSLNDLCFAIKQATT